MVSRLEFLVLTQVLWAQLPVLELYIYKSRDKIFLSIKYSIKAQYYH